MKAQLALELDPPPTAPRAAALRHHHVRAHEPVDEALAGEERAKRQEDLVLVYFQAEGRRLTPWDVAAALGLPITSARRAVTNLAGRGDLRHHPEDRRRAGPYGQRSGTWEALPSDERAANQRRT